MYNIMLSACGQKMYKPDSNNRTCLLRKRISFFFYLYPWRAGYHYKLEIIISISGEEELLKANEIKCSYAVTIMFKIILIFCIINTFWIILSILKQGGQNVTEQDPKINEFLSSQSVVS